MANRKRNCDTKTAVELAFYELLLRRDYEDINVKDICLKANVSRMSFYRYYNNKKDIFLSYCDDRFAEFYDNITRDNELDFDKFILEAFIFFKKYSRQIAIIIKSDQQHILDEQFHSYAKYIIAKDKNEYFIIDNTNPYTLKFFTGALFSILIKWVQNNCKESPEEMHDLIMDSLSSLGSITLKPYLNK